MAEFNYKISAKDQSGPGIKSAEHNLKGLNDVAQRMSKLMTLAFGAISIKVFADQLKQTVNLFGIQEKAELRLAAAARNNPLINGQAVKGLKAYAASLQEISIFGDEAIIQQQAFLTTLQLSEEQINGVMSAAVDLASTGIVSLDSAVKNIAKTYAGMTGELGELIPTLKQLTVEELKAGGAVDMIAEAYGGMAEAAAAGISGTMEQLKNKIGDMKEKIGGALAPIVKSIADAVSPIVATATAWIEDHSKQITNFFLHLPDIAEVAFTTLGNMVIRLFTWDAYSQVVVALGTFYLAFWKATLLTLWELVKAMGKTIWEPLKIGFEWVAYGINLAINGIIEGLNWLIEKAHDAGQILAHPFDKAKRLAYEGTGIGKLKAEEPGAVDTKAQEDAWRQFGSNLAGIGADLWTQVKASAAGIAAPFEDIMVEFREKVGVIINQDLPAAIQSPIAALEAALDKGAKAAGPSPSMGTMAIGDRGEGGTGIFTRLAIAIQPLLQGFMGLIQPLASMQMILNPLTTIFNAMMTVLQPMIDTLLTPLIGILTILGQTLGHILVPLFSILGPIIGFVADVFVWLYNKVLRPIGNALITIFNFVFNAIAAVANGFIFIYNLLVRKKKEKDYIKFRSLTEGHLAEITTGDVTAAGAETVSGEGAGAGANYTAGRTINQTVNIFTDVITGEGGFRQLAIMLRDEIYAAEQLGF